LSDGTGKATAGAKDEKKTRPSGPMTRCHRWMVVVESALRGGVGGKNVTFFTIACKGNLLWF